MIPALQSNIQNMNSYDPTRTTTLREQFAREMRRRFDRLARIARAAIIEKDCFGLQSPQPLALVEASLPGFREFNFPRSSQKVDAFMDWLNTMEEREILEIIEVPQIGAGIEGAWTNKYVDAAYRRGIKRARQQARITGTDIATWMMDSEGIQMAMRSPFHVDRVGLLFSRVYQDLKGITANMDTQISRVLSMGMAEGRGPRQLASLLDSVIRKGAQGDLGITDTLGRYIPAKRRAEILARTEIIRAHHMATIQEYRNWSVEGVRVQAEFTTAGDSRVCSQCASLEGNVYTLDQIERMIPVHPMCRCIALPIKPGEVPRVPATVRATEQPMNSIGGLNACIPRIVAFELSDLERPQACSDYVRTGGKWTYMGNEITDEAVIKRLDKLRIPPAWDNVVVAKDPAARIQAIGVDSAGRWQYRYSAEHIKYQSIQKFNRIKSFSRDIPAITKKVEEGIAQGSPEAHLLRMEMKTAIRIGSDVDFKARKKAYGLTTLLHEHVSVNGNKIILDFIAKEGKRAVYTFEDDVLAAFLKERKAATSVGEKLFPDVTGRKLNKYLQKLADGKKYTIKDFRTYHGTRIARDELKQYAGKTLTKTEKKKIVKETLKKVSDFLHNTPAMAKNSYINPIVWDYIGGLP